MLKKEKRKNIISARKRDVWLKYEGNKAKSKCFCCRKNVIFLCSGLHNTWQAGHIKSHNNGGIAEINNLHPICKQCNNDMNDEDWDDYVSRHTHLFHSMSFLTNYYKKYEKGIIWWQSLYRMHLSRKNSL